MFGSPSAVCLYTAHKLHVHAPSLLLFLVNKRHLKAQDGSRRGGPTHPDFSAPVLAPKRAHIKVFFSSGSFCRLLDVESRSQKDDVPNPVPRETGMPAVTQIQKRLDTSHVN